MHPFIPGWISNTGAWNGAVLGAPITIAQTDHAEDNTAQTTYTYSAKAFAIGTADATRLVVADITWRVAGTTTTASSVTIGGIAATNIGEARNTGGSNLTVTTRWQAAVPTGTTATVSAVFSGALSRSGIVVYTVIGSNGTVPTSGASTLATATASTGAPSTSAITVPANGGAIVGGGVNSTTLPSSITPTNYTTDLALTTVGTSLYDSGGHDTTSGSRTYTMTWAGTTTPFATMIASAWGP